MNLARAAQPARLRLIIITVVLAVASVLVMTSRAASARADSSHVFRWDGGTKPVIVLEHGAWAEAAWAVTATRAATASTAVMMRRSLAGRAARARFIGFLSQAGRQRQAYDVHQPRPGPVKCSRRCTGGLSAGSYCWSELPVLPRYECWPRLRLSQVTVLQQQPTCRVPAATGCQTVPRPGARAVSLPGMVRSSTCRSSFRDVMPSLGKIRYRCELMVRWDR